MRKGIYFIRLKKDVNLNDLRLHAGDIIYIGKGKDVDKRLKQELGKERGAATFFRSIGVLVGGKVIAGSGKNFRFHNHEDICRWLAEYADSEIIYGDITEEAKLIKEYKPRLNYMHNAENYLEGLLDLRAKAREIGIRRNNFKSSH